MWRPYAVNICRAIRNRKIARIHHPQVDMQRLPELPGAPRPGLGSLFPALVSPTLLDPFPTLHILTPVLVKTTNVRLKPRVEHRGSHALQKLADPIAPAKLFLRAAGRYEIHRPREVHSSALEQTVFPFWRSHARWLRLGVKLGPLLHKLL